MKTESLTLDNDAARLALPADNGAIQPGQLCLANESRFNSAFFSEPLTAYATGWRDQADLEGLLDFIAPPVQAGRRFEYKKWENAEVFQSELDDQRAIGADFKRIDFKGSSVVDKTFNKGLTLRLDLDMVGDMPNWREVYTARLLQRILRNDLRRAVDLLINNASDVAKTWDTTSGKDPDMDLLTELLNAANTSGVRPNRVLFGDVAWNKRLLAHRAQATAGGYASAGMTPQELSNFLGLDSIRISRDRYQNTASGKTPIVPSVVAFFNGEDGATVEDPTHLKRFWSATEGGPKYRVYEHPVNAKIVDLSVEHYTNVLLTHSYGLRKLTIS